MHQERKEGSGLPGERGLPVCQAAVGLTGPSGHYSRARGGVEGAWGGGSDLRPSGHPFPASPGLERGQSLTFFQLSRQQMGLGWGGGLGVSTAYGSRRGIPEEQSLQNWDLQALAPEPHRASGEKGRLSHTAGPLCPHGLMKGLCLPIPRLL
jgi:hypothetical protein